jgi:hypothetical protein
MKNMTPQQIAERLRHAAAIVEAKGLDGASLVNVSVNGWGQIEILTEVETLLAMYPAQFKGRHGEFVDDKAGARFCACISSEVLEKHGAVVG